MIPSTAGIEDDFVSKPEEKTKSLNTRLIINVIFSSNVIGLKDHVC